MSFRRKAPTSFAIIAATGLVLTGCSSDGGGREDFPSDTIELIVPFSAGGASDVQARAFAQAYEEANDATVLVVNRPGGGSSIGAMEASNARPDGYTLFHSTASTFISLPLMEEVGYQADDFRSIISYGDLPTIVVAAADTGWESLDDVPTDEEMSIATTSPGNVLHLTVSNFVDEAGGTSRYLPFDSSNETIQAVVNGNADLAGADPGLVLPRVDSGELVPLAVASTERLEVLPDVPTFEEAGFERSHDRYSRSAISVPSETPDEVIDILKEGAAEAFATDTWQSYVESSHIQSPGYEAEAFLDEFVPDETAWTLESFEAAGVSAK
ncbi:tripartite tricarboxylate transporter substrate binding protein [Citricoccus sp. NR2]|uniref:tripartite tricarboxylate transporter substrate binding protein n=1 Tax=Citricoccus sp. NR2 TaxID=3004095 RepID=UPI0022DD1AE6|nr:tripartite tricarboxylate transporter substrate binding protein [Citricoccus sp. NR2]WBL19495.1 tripartite tricarboxylate transporter substrate binding protein [Citricoccus sp. NR2]